MNKQNDWFLKLTRIAGASFPGSASLVQLQSEINSVAFEARLEKLEDPISSLHEDIPEFSKAIYEKILLADSEFLEFPNDFYIRYSRCLALLESKGFISKMNTISTRIPLGITVIDEFYIIYICKLYEDSTKMQIIFDIFDKCEVGIWLNGAKLKESVGLPITVIKAVAKIYASKNYGLLSNEVGTCNYQAIA